MEVIGLLIEALMSWLGKLPIEFLLAVLMGLVGYIIKKINQIQKSFAADINGLRSEQSKMKQEYMQSAEELKAAINKLSVDLSSELESQKEKINESYMLSLRTAIMNETFPDNFRLEKYDEYKANKGNSFIDNYVNKNLLKSDTEGQQYERT